MSLCIASAEGIMALAISAFVLSWEHSVERQEWVELWDVSGQGLRPVLGSVLGSGAGMEVPEGAVLKHGAWHYIPDLPWQREVWLAASGATASGWRLCAGDDCLVLGKEAQAPIRLWSATECLAQD